MILFLDFDGVLYPEGEDHILNGGTDFCSLPRLETLLREFPHVGIVISSSWREQVLYKTLLQSFSSAHQDGTTSQLSHGPRPLHDAAPRPARRLHRAR